jgi:hypothetical protein
MEFILDLPDDLFLPSSLSRTAKSACPTKVGRHIAHEGRFLHGHGPLRAALLPIECIRNVDNNVILARAFGLTYYNKTVARASCCMYDEAVGNVSGSAQKT